MGSIHYLIQGAKSAERGRNRMNRSGYTPKGHALWSEDELATVKLMHGKASLAEISAKLGRSYSAVRSKAQALGLAPRRHIWTGAEIALLRRTYRTGAREDLEAAFPGRNADNLKHVAHYHGIFRQRRAFFATGFPLIDQIRARAFDLGYSMVDVDELARSRKYFQKGGWATHLNHKALARAVEALDGKLTAVWRDPEEPARRARG